MKPKIPYLIPYPKSLRMNPKGGVIEFDPERLTLPDRPKKNPANLIELRFDPDLDDEAYRIVSAKSGITIFASSAHGMNYSTLTLSQLFGQYKDHKTGRIRLPFMKIEDAPDFAHRGFMLDVSRGRVPKMETLFRLVDLLAVLKYNRLQLYIEHTFAFKKHPLLGKGHSPLTPKEIRELDRYCAQNGIALVPNLQSFGHAAHILKLKRYHDLAESEFRGGWTLSPEEPGTYKLLGELYDEFLPCFPDQPNFNVGCDETWDLGRGKSKARAEKVGLGRVYLGHLLKVHKLVKKHKRRMMFWGDIIEKYPDLVPEIPEDVVVLNWEYETEGEEKRYRKRLQPAVKAGLEHWICPGTSTWNSFFFRRTNARINMREFAKAGLSAGAKGYLLTTWGDNGHYNFLSASLWGIAYGADCAWRAKPDPQAEALFDERFASLILDDDEGRFIEPIRLLGDLYRAFGVTIKNTSPERMLLTGRFPPTPLRLGVVKEVTEYNKIGRKNLEAALKIADQAANLLRKIPLDDDETRQIRDEWLLGAELSAHACRRALWHNHRRGDPQSLKAGILKLASRFEELWLRQDRESDLQEIREDFARIAKGYEADPPEPIVF